MLLKRCRANRPNNFKDWRAWWLKRRTDRIRVRIVAWRSRLLRSERINNGLNTEFFGDDRWKEMVLPIAAKCRSRRIRVVGDTTVGANFIRDNNARVISPSYSIIPFSFNKARISSALISSELKIKPVFSIPTGLCSLAQSAMSPAAVRVPAAFR